MTGDKGILIKAEPAHQELVGTAIRTVYIKGQKIASVYEVGLVHRKLVQSRAGDMSASTLFRIQTGSPRES